MAASVPRTLERIKQDLRPFLPEESVLDACRRAGHAWRERKLGPVATVHLFVLQVLWFNTAMAHLRHLAGHALSAGAYCRARTRLPLAVLQQLLRESSAAMRSAPAAQAGALWHGLRAYLVDASSTITPDVPGLQKAFGQPKGCKAGCGFPVPKLLALFDAFTGLVVEVLALPLYTHEQSQVWRLHPLLGPGDLLVGDCGFCSFAHLAMLWGRGVCACFRVHQRQIVDFRPRRRDRGRLPSGERKGRPTSVFVRRLGRRDHVVRWRKQHRPKWMSDAQWEGLPETLEVRELRYTIPRRGQRTLCVTVATTLLDPALYPRDAVAELYHARWRVETHFAQLKTTLGMRKLKSKTEGGMRKELAAYCLVYNLVHAAMTEAARRQGVTPDRVGFLDAVRWLLSAAPGEELPTLLVNPHRPGRHEPRVVKDREDTYTKMTRPRGDLRKALKKQGRTA